jgi:necrosis inducing protein (NPP1)
LKLRSGEMSALVGEDAWRRWRGVKCLTFVRGFSAVQGPMVYKDSRHLHLLFGVASASLTPSPRFLTSSSPVKMLFKKFALLLTAGLASAGVIERRAQEIAHDAVRSIPETLPNDATGRSMKRFQPYVNTEGAGCWPYPAVDTDGNWRFVPRLLRW